MPNPAGNLIVGSDDEMDERVTRLKRRLGVPDRPVESRVDPAMANGTPEKRRPAHSKSLPRGLPDAKHCKGCRAWFQPSKNAQRYCDRCREAKAEKRERPSADRPEAAGQSRNGNAPGPSPKPQLAPVERGPVEAATPLGDRLFARLESFGVRLFTGELSRMVGASPEQTEDALYELVASGRVECVMSWKVKR